MDKLQKKFLNKAKRESVKRGMVLHCYDVIFPDGSRGVGFTDPRYDYNGFGFIYTGNIFAIVENGRIVK